MQRPNSFHKGFTLLEMLLVLLIATIAIGWQMSQFKFNNFLKHSDTMMSDIATIVSSGILDPYVGYISSRNQYCSSSNYYEDISAYRVSQCAPLNSLNVVFDGSVGDENDEKDPTLSYFQWLSTWGDTGDGCKGIVATGDDNATEFNFLLDCSDLPASYIEGLESRAITYQQSTFPSIFYGYDINATDLNTSGGDEEDGIVLLKFKK